MIAGTVGGPTVYEAALGRLDARIREKYDAITDNAEDLALATRAAFSQWEEMHQRLVEARTAHTAAEHAEAHSMEVTAQKRHGTYKPSLRLTSAAAALARAEERAAARLQERDRVQQRSNDALAVARAVAELVASADVTDLAPVVVPRPTSSTAADLARVRETLATIDKEAKALVVAPVPADQAHAALDAFLDTVAAAYDPKINCFALPSQTLPPAPGDLVPYEWAPLLASLPPFRTLLHDKLAAAYANFPASVPDTDRVTMARTLGERRRKLELQEEVLVLAGTGLSRRADVDPLVVLTTMLAEAR